jgi:hypothetical protein
MSKPYQRKSASRRRREARKRQGHMWLRSFEEFMNATGPRLLSTSADFVAAARESNRRLLRLFGGR